MPPVIIAAGVAAAATVGGAVIASGSQKSAAKSASNIAQQTTDSNNALQRETRDQNVALATPWMNSGLQANGAINALLGLGGSTSAPQAPATMSYGPAGSTAPINPLTGSYGAPGGDFAGRMSNPLMTADAGDVYRGPGMSGSAPIPYNPNDVMTPMNGAAPAASPPPTNVTGSSPYNTAFQNFLNSTGFQFQMDQGNKAVNQGYAARGTLQSGAAMKALQDRGQQTALNNYFLPYMNLLGQQQGVGLSATNATMGVGTNYANQVSANNLSAGTTAANAALATGAANANMWGGIAGGIGNAAGQIFGSSYKNPLGTVSSGVGGYAGGGSLPNFGTSGGNIPAGYGSMLAW